MLPVPLAVPVRRVEAVNWSPLFRLLSAIVGGIVSRTIVRTYAFATLPAMSVATIDSVWVPSADPSRRKPVVKLKCPVASSVSAVAAPPSIEIVAPPTPDRLSTIWPENVTFALVVAGVSLARTTGACVSLVCANRAST